MQHNSKYGYMQHLVLDELNVVIYNSFMDTKI